MIIMSPVSSHLILLLTTAQLLLPSAFATDSIFDTKLYFLKDFAHYFCPLINAAKVTGIKKEKKELVDMGPFYTKQVKTALAAAKNPLKTQSGGKGCGCCNYIRNFLIYISFIGVVLFVGYAKGEYQRQFGPSNANLTTNEEEVENHPVKVELPPFTQISNSNKEIWVHYKPYYVKVVNLWEGIVTIFNSNPHLFIGEVVLIVVGLCLLTHYLVRRKRRRVEKGSHLTIDGVQYGPMKRGAEGGNDGRMMVRRKVGWGRREEVQQKMPLKLKGWSDYSQFFGGKWEGGKMKKAGTASVGKGMEKGVKLGQLVQKWTPKRKVAVSDNNPTVLVSASPTNQRKPKARSF